MSELKLGLAIAVATLAVGGCVAIAHAALAPAAAAPPPPGPAPAPGTWTRSATMSPGDTVRVSVAASDLHTIAQSIGISTVDLEAWENVLANPVLQSAFGATTMSAWGPDASGTMQPGPLPSDWPLQDAQAASEYHAQFVYGGAAPISVASLPVPLLVWVRHAAA